MSEPPKRPCAFGLWPSRINAEIVAGGAIRFGRVEVFEGVLYWGESRPAEGGRAAIMRQKSGGEPEDLLPAPFSARSRVHEYGGGEFHVTRLGVFFVNDEDQQVYLLKEGCAPLPITQAPGVRFADFAYDAARGRLIAVAERHESGGDAHAHPENCLAAINLTASPEAAVSMLVEGASFYASPRLSPDGRGLAWLQWNLPAMPWDEAALMLAEVADDGGLGAPHRIAGGGNCAAFQPEWGEDGALYFVSDEDGEGALYAWRKGETRRITGAGYDLSRPLWSFNLKSYSLGSGGRAIVAFTKDGVAGLGLVSPPSDAITPIETDLLSIEHICALEDGFAAVGAARTHPAAIIARPLGSSSHNIIRAGACLDLDEGDIASGLPMRFKGPDGAPVYGCYYAPQNRDYEGPPGDLPPLIMTAHGGPTSRASRGFSSRTQFFTTRGFAVFDLDYSGSTGYGRDYRNRLSGFWGVRDVEDAETAARALVEAKQAAPGRIFLYGSSAGGYTALMALAKSKAFAGGVSAYGISDLAILQRTTHKFESGYIYGLIGADESNAEARLRERSPLTHADEIAAPVLLLQGLDDKVVPPEQSAMIAESLKRRGVPVTYLTFDGEAHGFRRAETIAAALEAELAFYRRVLGLEGAACEQISVNPEAVRWP